MEIELPKGFKLLSTHTVEVVAGWNTNLSAKMLEAGLTATVTAENKRNTCYWGFLDANGIVVELLPDQWTRRW